jgi:hypothetical protein
MDLMFIASFAFPVGGWLAKNVLNRKKLLIRTAFFVQSNVLGVDRGTSSQLTNNARHVVNIHFKEKVLQQNQCFR